MSILYPESYQIPVMKYASKISDQQAQLAFSSGQWLGQEKKDGALYQLEKTKSGYVYLFSRSISKKTGELAEKSDNFPHIKQWAFENLPNETVIVGEIYVVGGHSNDVTKLSGCLPQNAINRQFKMDNYGGPAHYYMFDVLYWNGESLLNKGFEDRVKYLDNLNETEYIEIAKTIDSNFEEKLQKIFSAGGEGMVFKKKDCPYRAGMRATTRQAFKWKEHMDNLDFICIGLEDPIKEYTGKEIETWPYWEDDIAVTKPYYYHWKNAMRVGVYKNNEIIEIGRVASGFTDEMRADMATHPEKYLEQVVEISCMSVDKKAGTFRHPVFCQMRYDKNPKECLWEEIF